MPDDVKPRPQFKLAPDLSIPISVDKSTTASRPVLLLQEGAVVDWSFVKVLNDLLGAEPDASDRIVYPDQAPDDVNNQ